MPEKHTLYAVFLVLFTFLIVTGCTSTPGSAPVKNASGAPATDTLSAAPAPSGTASSCVDGLALCSGFCRDLRTDASNCGMCGITCPSGQGCSGGVCKPSAECGGSTCPVPTAVPTVKGTVLSTTLPGVTTMATTVPLVTTVTTTTLSCSAGQTVCAGKCVDLKTDNNNCGSCGDTCPTGTRCDGLGMCGAVTTVPTATIAVAVTGHSLPVDRFGLCPRGYTVCGSDCVFLMNDTSNCGACGAFCSGKLTCEAGFCTCTPEMMIKGYCT